MVGLLSRQRRRAPRPSLVRGFAVLHGRALHLPPAALPARTYSAGHAIAAGLRPFRVRLHLQRAAVTVLRALALAALAAIALLLVRLSGSGMLTVTGTARRLEAGLAGSGDLRLQGLESRDARATVSGSGRLQVWATHAPRLGARQPAPALDRDRRPRRRRRLPPDRRRPRLRRRAASAVSSEQFRCRRRCVRTGWRSSPRPTARARSSGRAPSVRPRARSRPGSRRADGRSPREASSSRGGPTT